MKPTAAQKRWLKRIDANGEVHWPLPTADMAGRLEVAGLFEIIDEEGKMGWPYSGWFLRITKIGRGEIGADPS